MLTLQLRARQAVEASALSGATLAAHVRPALADCGRFAVERWPPSKSVRLAAVQVVVARRVPVALMRQWRVGDVRDTRRDLWRAEDQARFALHQRLHTEVRRWLLVPREPPAVSREVRPIRCQGPRAVHEAARHV